jgi:shikimate kinase
LPIVGISGSIVVAIAYVVVMSARTSIFLVGPMGSGKSAVGRRLAQGLGLGFCDSDEEIESRTGVDIPFIFEKEGEAGFRRREERVIDELTALEAIVLATGGGSVADPDSRARLASRGTVVYLYASVDQQLERTRKGRERPLLASGDPRETLEALMTVRDPLYRKIADIIVETDSREVRAVAKEIEEKLAHLEGGGS